MSIESENAYTLEEVREAFISGVYWNLRNPLPGNTPDAHDAVKALARLTYPTPKKLREVVNGLRKYRVGNCRIQSAPIGSTEWEDAGPASLFRAVADLLEHPYEEDK